MRTFAFGLILVLLSVLGALADPQGTYEVTGTNPGTGSKYSGAVVVERTGDTFRVTWIVNGQRIIGIGIGKTDYLAVSYRIGNNLGLAVYTESGEDWTGIWAPAGSRELGTEKWTRRRTGP